MVEWWNGQSAVLDFSNPLAVEWFNQQLVRLMDDYGIDGFKFDAGDMYLVLEGLCGYPFSCPDMIGGGEWTSFLDPSTLDQDLMVRSAQCHALMPMMKDIIVAHAGPSDQSSPVQIDHLLCLAIRGFR